MKSRFVFVCLLVACLTMAFCSPAFAGVFGEDGRNIYAWPKAGANWTAQLNSPTDPSLNGVAHLVETACHRGVGLGIVAPQAMPMADHAIVSVLSGGRAYDIYVADYQLGFLFVLDYWPPAPWPVPPMYAGEDMPMFVEFGTELGAEGLFEALNCVDGSVTITVYDAQNAVLLQGIAK